MKKTGLLYVDTESKQYRDWLVRKHHFMYYDPVRFEKMGYKECNPFGKLSENAVFKEFSTRLPYNLGEKLAHLYERNLSKKFTKLTGIMV